VTESLLRAAGWTPAGDDEWSHPHYGTRPREVAVLVAARKREMQPARARRCRCQYPLIDRDTTTGTRRCVLCGRRRREFRAIQAKEEIAVGYNERITTTRLSDDGRRPIIVERWLDRQVMPPRWRSKNRHIKLKPNEIEYYRQRAAEAR
jgi:hypothetical protein